MHEEKCILTMKRNACDCFVSSPLIEQQGNHDRSQRVTMNAARCLMHDEQQRDHVTMNAACCLMHDEQ